MTLSKLTPRLRQVALLMADGLTNAEIGEQMGIKESVVKNYSKPIFDTLGVWTRLELAVLLASNGLV